MYSLNELFHPEIKYDIVEDTTGLVDGENILAVVEGEFFVPNGMSRNGRFYPRKLWERVIGDTKIKAKLEDRIMFGTIGHDAPLGNAAIREGIVSHCMDSIRIDENGKGIGRALILGTPAGRILNTVMRAGCKIATSSRANGTFKGKHQGKPVVDEATYDLEGWDFVIDPGFLEAKPEIKEELQELYKQNKIENRDKGDDIMSGETNDKLVEKLANEVGELKVKLSKQFDEVEGLKEDNKTLKEENAHVKTELEKLEKAEETVAAYEEFGTVEEIKEKLEKAEANEKVLEAFGELAESPEDAKTALEASDKFITEVEEAFGSLEKGKEAVEKLSKYEELGEPEKVKEVLEAIDAKFEAEKAEKVAESVKRVSEKTGLSEEKVTSLLEKISEEDILEIHGKKVDEDNDDFKKKNKTEESDINEENDNEEEISEGLSLAEKIGGNLIG